MKAIILSCTPTECEKIANGDMSILVRKKAPKEVPFKAYIYCTKSDRYLLDSDYDGSLFCWDNKSHHYPFKFEKDFDGLFNGKVIGKFICDKVYLIKNQGSSFSVADEEQSVTNEIARQSCLDYYDMVGYLGNKDGYGWHISDLKIYGKPKELSEFSPICSYKNDDGSCQYRKVDCLYQQRDYNTDGSVNIVTCGKSITRPPKNYIYVEE